MKCPFCGTENIAGRTHCIACATPLPIVVQPEPVALVEPNIPPQIVNSANDQGVVSSNVSDIQPPSPVNAETLETHAAFEPIMPEDSSVSSQAPVASTPSWLEPSSAAEPEPIMPEVAVPVAIPVPEIPASQVQVGEGRQSAQPRVNVHFDEKEVEEVQMPVHQEQVLSQSPSLPDEQPDESTKAGESEAHTGPWLALTVLGGGLVIVILIIYFLYRLIFGGATEPTVNPQPTITVVPTPTITTNDIQRERDADELKIALSSYYRDKQRYPSASTYNGLLNALIGGNYLTRRVQDPAFPGQEYKYAVDSSGSSYEIVITFDTLASTLLQGSGSTVYRLEGSQGN